MPSQDKRQFQEYIESTLDISEELAVKMVEDSPDTPFVWTGSKKRRRIVRAIVSSCPNIAEKFPSLGQVSTETCLVNVAGFYHDTPEWLEEDTYMAAAAALWIRDHIEGSDDGTPFLLKMARDTELQQMDMDLVPMYHADRPCGVDEALAKIVANRLTKDHYLYDDYSPSRNGPTNALYQETLKYLAPGLIEHVESVFLDRFMAYLETAMKIARIFILELDRKFDEMARELEKSKTVLAMEPAEDPLDDLLRREDREADPEIDPIADMYFINTHLEVLVHGMGAVLDGEKYRERILKIAGEFDPLHTSDGEDVDPFEMAFGYCRMMDKNDDLVFLLGVSLPLMRIYAYLLPWSDSYRDKKSNVFLPSWCAKSQSVYVRRVWFKEERGKKPDPVGYYYSLAQFAYNPSRYVMTTASAEAMNFWIEKKKLTKSDILLVADTVNLIVDEHKLSRSVYADASMSLQEEEEQEEDLPDEEEEAEQEPGEPVSEREIRLQKELKEVQKQLKDSERGRIAAERENRKIMEDTGARQRELFDLRELLYRSLSENEPEEEEPAEDDKKMLPYTARKRTVIFGGHDSWRKAIKDMLNGVTLVPNRKLVNTDLIRNADVIWIQVNAISHAAYYAICDYAKTHDVPIRYFTYSSAAACAVQLAKADAQ